MLFRAQSFRLMGRVLSGRRSFLLGRRHPQSGGGCPLPGRRAWLGLLTAAATLLLSTAPAAASNLLYYGGPVVHTARVILVKWGADVRATYTNPTTGDPGFLKYLTSQDGSTSDIGGVLAQYMDSSTHNSQNRFSYGGTVQINPAVAPTPPGSVKDSQIQAALTKAIGAGTLPTPGGRGLSTIYAVLFPPGDNVCFDDNGGCAYDGGGFCAYHGSFQLSGSTAQVLYAAMVDDGPGTPNFGGCGVGVASDVGNQTSVFSHEVSETVNDPLDSVTTWYDFNDNGEIADKCDGEPAGANGPWTVESLWSNRDKGCRVGESALFHAPAASFLAPSTGMVGQGLSFNAAGSTDPAGNGDSALNQNTHKSFSISPGIVGYRWNWGDGTPATTAGSSTAGHTFAAAGNYQVSLTVTDRLGFTSTKTQQVSVSTGAPGTPTVTTLPAAAVSQTGATLKGTINPAGQTVTYRFRYGTSPGSLTASTPVTSGPAGQSAVPVSATVTGLSPSTKYYFQLVASTGSNSYPGSVQSLTTSSSSPPPQTPVVATGGAGRVGPSGALLTGMINPGGPAPVYYRFAYGTSAATLGHATPRSTQPGGTTAKLVTATLTGLAPRTKYFFRLRVSFNGHVYLGAVRSFTTSARLPGVTTEAASHIAGDSAVLSGLVNPHGIYTYYQVQFGRTASYGHSTTWIVAGSQTTAQAEQIVLFGLNPGTVYHDRFVAQNRFGTVVGHDRMFTSARRATAAPRFRFRAPAALPWRRLVSHSLRVHFGCSRACLAHFVLLVQRADQARSDVLPVTVSRQTARSSRTGSGAVRLHLRSRFRRELPRARDKRLRLVLVGYAKAHGSVPSSPQRATIRITG
jgi:hypothetical protein